MDVSKSFLVAKSAFFAYEPVVERSNYTDLLFSGWNQPILNSLQVWNKALRLTILTSKDISLRKKCLTASNNTEKANEATQKYYLRKIHVSG